ncbi:MAG TPA: hypothetical protein VHE57_08495 [Mycobacteriales bacterium]|nr:hypothetical protein [Mycobacteriales bacterium]
MSEHYTLDELAELDAGLLARRQTSRATRHLAECAECRDRADALRRTRDRLAELGPVEMPPEVTARLDRALNEARTTSGSDVVPDLSSIRARRLGGIPPWGYAVAAAVVVLGGTAIAIGTIHHGKSGPTPTALAPIVGTSAPPVLIQKETGQTYSPTSIEDLATGLLGAPHEAASVGSAPGAAVLPSAQAGGGAAADKKASRSPERFGVTNAAPAPALAAPTGRVPPSLRHLADSRDALLQCAAFITDTANAAPLAVDFGRWTNADAGIHRVPAVVMVFADPDDATTIDVFVVKASCDESSLLDFQVLRNKR